MPLDVVVCVNSAEEACTLTKLKQISPPEMLFAYIEAIAQDITKGDDEVLQRWRATMLACPARFTLLTCTDQIHRLCVQFREDMSQNHATLRFSAIQRMFDVRATIQRKTDSTGAPTATAICEYYDSIQQAETSERISKEFVDCAMTVLKRMWSIPKCAALLMQLEQWGTNNPLDSIYKLHKVRAQAILLQIFQSPATVKSFISSFSIGGGRAPLTGRETDWATHVFFENLIFL